ncbi:pyridoxal phosphate-dependent aminotransferase [Falsochrobactrum sp. TDYN1]|uniref:Pyridoxal phosphate-dependent aminotransferase n=1 Tax=Falsochrobactrum tianjinense TaxID=2706015 RepID=A0A949PKY8_9HYPH|nr:pyridoxal phosphate-dependent aminotransferase [Falsochrobactrum sp. TDYN1]MBV2142443.1 pyridoxal phosphate-dependent aminotransferase [Falsochrobactrum sp. TDYN1]
MTLIANLRREAAQSPESGIVAVFNHGRGKPGLIPLWVGEGDLPTPDFISQAASKGIADGETFYTWQAGIPELREALARYHARHFAMPLQPENFYVTGSGMHAIEMALRATTGAGEETIYLSPAWPNFVGAAGLAGVIPVPVQLEFGANGWTLDPEKIASAVTPHTRSLFINTPSNPTGWTADHEMLRFILDLAREKGLWIIADEIYSHFHYSGGRAPSFMDIMEPDDRIIFVNSFSKNWAMTGWRIGWMTVHPSLGPVVENMIQYSNSGVAQFMQRGAVAALDEGDGFIAMQVERARSTRDRLCAALQGTGKVRLTPPQGAFYLFFGVEGVTDSVRAAINMVDNANVGLAPGSAFGAGGEGFFRLCFGRDPQQIDEAAARLVEWIDRN